MILDQAQWRGRCHLEKLYIHQALTSVQDATQVRELLEKDEKQHLILWISQLNFATSLFQNVSSDNNRLLHLTAKVKKMGVSYSIRNHYAALLFLKSLTVIKTMLKRTQEVAISSTPETMTTKPKIVADIHLDIGRVDIQLGLPFEKKVYLRLDEFNINKNTSQEGKLNTQFRNMMVLGVSPLHKNKWEQLVELDQVQIICEISPILADSIIDLRAKKIFATVPYKFVLSAVIDSIIGLVKAIKELHGRILNPEGNVFTFFGPTIKNDPITIPYIKLRTKLFSVYFDDDPFEARLRNILRTGLAEQQRRLAYENALEAKVYDMLSTAEPSIRSQVAYSTDANMENTNQQTTVLETSQNVPYTFIQPQVEEAQRNLMEHFSKFWIKHINKAKNDEKEFYTELFAREHYRNSESATAIDKVLDDGDSRRQDRFLYSKTFIIDILPRPAYPPLAGFSAQYAKIYFKRANLETRKFMYHTGGGVPLDDNFSIIIPFHLSIKAGKTWIKARDYPLPLLYVPPSAGDGKNTHTSWTLEGNYVAADELGNSGGSRIIPITIIPKKSDTALGYCLSAVRTTSPLKFYSVIDYHVFAQDMSMICWSVSNSPVIQDILRVLDTLTAAQVDPSPRIGFWDKVRFIIHSKIKIHFTGDLAFVVKGTRDPYQLKGRGAGLAKLWSNNVVWLLGHKNSQNEFMQIISDNYAFGVPDLVRGGFVPDTLPDSMSQYNGVEKNERHRFLKVALKLTDGIRMGIGLSFERLSCHSEAIDDSLCFNCQNQHMHVIDKCRSQVFLPHYKVLFQSVEQVAKYHDSVFIYIRTIDSSYGL